MNLKEFLGPSWGKIIFVIIFFLLNGLVAFCLLILSAFWLEDYILTLTELVFSEVGQTGDLAVEGSDAYLGFPMRFLLIQSTRFRLFWKVKILCWGFLVDLLLYYFFACVIVHFYIKLKRGKN